MNLKKREKIKTKRMIEKQIEMQNRHFKCISKQNTASKCKRKTQELMQQQNTPVDGADGDAVAVSRLQHRGLEVEARLVVHGARALSSSGLHSLTNKKREKKKKKKKKTHTKKDEPAFPR